MSIKTRLQKLELANPPAASTSTPLVVIYKGRPPQLQNYGRVRVLLPANGREAVRREQKKT